MNDPFGEAILDYFEKGEAPDIIVNTNYTKDEDIPVAYLFRTEDNMPELELIALNLCKGKILDIGAAAGCHSLALQSKGLNVTALEISPLAAETMEKRGIKRVIQDNIYTFSGDNFDTLLLLMNGAGIGGSITGLSSLMRHLKDLLNEGGQILIDSSDINYLFEEDDGSVWMDLANSNYYGEMKYEIQYKNSISQFDWLFIDFEKLKVISNEMGLDCELIFEGKHHEYLARLT